MGFLFAAIVAAIRMIGGQTVRKDYQRKLAQAVYGTEYCIPHINPLCEDAANLINRLRQTTNRQQSAVNNDG